MDKPSSSSNTLATLAYASYLLSTFLPFVWFAGLIIAYYNRSSAEGILVSHYQFIIRTFWISLLFLMIGALLSYVMIGFLIIALTIIWMVVRCVKGLLALNKNQPIENPTSWLFG
ncbi:MULTISPECIES: DUF4870 family protein [Thiomicrorhabdus]|uniref:DUF4870 domain-containing protein n=1 Tax=Thiomicrorhabdus heinhorstiae TaxID=2748010 RepID=A0ABS0C0Y8_9GAMM|nr:MULTISPECIES: hypothetical protein [Thiomicrorhabdus]MBF6058934.1 hypothetical protein [Thiomicrorhabdus heinhorstiae]